MSYASLMKHRCTILRQSVDLKTGSPSYGYTEVQTNVRCYIDLNFIRKGKDPMWSAESGRSADRSGVCFFMGSAPIQNGDWIKITRGPVGVFSIETAIDEAWRPSNKHHLEVSVLEVPKQYAAPQVGAPLPPTTPVPEFPATQREGINEISEMGSTTADPFGDIPGMD